MEYVLTTQGLTKQYKKFKALDGFSMSVPKGSIYGLVGRNGAGKTTLIRLICGLQASDGRRIHAVRKQQRRRRDRPGAQTDGRCGGDAVHLRRAERRRQPEGAHRILGLPSDEGIDQLCGWVGLEHTGRKKAKNFSLGMRQRLGIAIALAGSPDFLVLDEPVNGLDPQGIIEMRELILKLNREHSITVLISSHILDELSRLATHYGFVDRGRMVREISAKELEQACRKCVRAEVTDVKALAMVLDQMGVEYNIISKHTADLFAKVNVTRLAAALAEEGCEILSMEERDESLESYFVSLVGGESRE